MNPSNNDGNAEQTKTLDFQFSLDRIQTGPLTKPWNLEVRIEGTLSVYSRGRLLLHEVSVCLVELAFDVMHWLENSDKSNDFTYTCMDVDEREFLSIKQSKKGWKVSAVWQDFADEEFYSFEEVRFALADYVGRLKSLLLAQYDIDIQLFYDQFRPRSQE